MKPTIKVTAQVNKLANLSAITALMNKMECLVGVPEDKAPRNGGGEDAPRLMNNAAIAYVHEYGAPEAGIPARPFLIPGINASKKEVVAILKRAGKAVLKLDSVESAKALLKGEYTKIGFLVSGKVRAQFKNNNWPALKAATLNRRRMISITKVGGKTIKRYGKSRRESGKTKPLIDTAQLMRSITFVVEEK